MLTTNQRDILAGVFTLVEIAGRDIPPCEAMGIYVDWRKIIEVKDTEDAMDGCECRGKESVA